MPAAVGNHLGFDLYAEQISLWPCGNHGPFGFSPSFNTGEGGPPWHRLRRRTGGAWQKTTRRLRTSSPRAWTWLRSSRGSWSPTASSRWMRESSSSHPRLSAIAPTRSSFRGWPRSRIAWSARCAPASPSRCSVTSTSMASPRRACSRRPYAPSARACAPLSRIDSMRATG